MKKVGDTMLKEWLEKAGPEGQAARRRATASRRAVASAPRRSTLLYDGAAWLAALFMVGLLAMVLLSIAGRQLDFHVPRHRRLRRLHDGRERLPGARPHLQARRAHPRDAAAGARCTARLRRGFEVWALVAATAARRRWAPSTACALAWQSRAFNDISTGSDATPLWIPQLAMAVGTVILPIALSTSWCSSCAAAGAARRDRTDRRALHE